MELAQGHGSWLFSLEAQCGIGLPTSGSATRLLNYPVKTLLTIKDHVPWWNVSPLSASYVVSCFHLPGRLCVSITLPPSAATATSVGALGKTGSPN